jgi:hypothetical protein
VISRSSRVSSAQSGRLLVSSANPADARSAQPQAALVRRPLALAGGFLVAGGACTLAALSLPPLWAIVTAQTARQVRLIGEHQGAWQLGLLLWGISAALTMPGMLSLASALRGSSTTGARGLPAADAALRAAEGLFAVGTGLWLANLAFGETTAVSVAAAVRGGSAIPGWFQPVQEWASGLWQVGAPMLGLSLMLYGLAIRAAAMLPSWAGWLALALGIFVIMTAAVWQGTPPFLIYLLGTLPLGIAAVLRTRTPGQNVLSS